MRLLHGWALSGRLTRGALQQREAGAFTLRETQLNGVVVSINTTARRIEFIVVSVLLILGVLGGINFFTGWLEPYRIWSAVAFLAGLAGFVRLVYALLERPMPALGTVLNAMCRWLSKRRLTRLGLASELERLEYKNGRAQLKAVEVLPAPEPNIPVDEGPRQKTLVLSE